MNKPAPKPRPRDGDEPTLVEFCFEVDGGHAIGSGQLDVLEAPLLDDVERGRHILERYFFGSLISWKRSTQPARDPWFD